MAYRQQFQPKDPAETISLPFDFTADLGGETIQGTPGRTALVDAGVDGNPSAILGGNPVVSGGVVYVSVLGGVPGVDYVVRCVATTSGGRVLVLAGLLPVRT